LHRIFIGIGSNLGDRIENIRKAVEQIGDIQGTSVTKISPFYETNPVGFKSKNLFLNGVIEAKTHLSPSMLLEKFLAIEKALGRTRKNFLYTDRIIDLDILVYDDIILNSEDLIIPHPEISKRLFVLAPFKDLDPDFIIPGLNMKILQLYQNAFNDKANQERPIRIKEIVF
jgi:2-amino-4-hydroxy-6-hydroxymethyldihydropteridine diphosphokinase